MDPFLGQIMIVGFNFAPSGWALCDGQLLPIQQNVALFALLGTTYGGDGETTFALPDLRGRVPLHWGLGTGLQNYVLGEVGGSETVTLIVHEMPAHQHTVKATVTRSDQGEPSNRYLGASMVPQPNKIEIYRDGPIDEDDVTSMAADMIGSSGGSQPHQNTQPFLGVTFIIALEGIFPSSN